MQQMLGGGHSLHQQHLENDCSFDLYILLEDAFFKPGKTAACVTA